MSKEAKSLKMVVGFQERLSYLPTLLDQPAISNLKKGGLDFDSIHVDAKSIPMFYFYQVMANCASLDAGWLLWGINTPYSNELAGRVRWDLFVDQIENLNSKIKDQDHAIRQLEEENQKLKGSNATLKEVVACLVEKGITPIDRDAIQLIKNILGIGNG